MLDRAIVAEGALSSPTTCAQVPILVAPLRSSRGTRIGIRGPYIQKLKAVRARECQNEWRLVVRVLSSRPVSPDCTGLAAPKRSKHARMSYVLLYEHILLWKRAPNPTLVFNQSRSGDSAGLQGCGDGRSPRRNCNIRRA